MLHYTLICEKPIFFHCGRATQQVTLPAFNLDDITFRKLIPLAIDSQNAFEDESDANHCVFEVIRPEPGEELDRFDATLWVGDAPYTVYVVMSVPYTDAPLNIIEDYSISNLYTPMIRALGNYPWQMHERPYEACVSVIHKECISLYHKLKAIPFSLSKEGHYLTEVLYGTPPSGDDRADAIKYIGELLGRSLSSMWGPAGAMIEQAHDFSFTSDECDDELEESSLTMSQTPIALPSEIDFDHQNLKVFNTSLFQRAQEFVVGDKNTLNLVKAINKAFFNSTMNILKLLIANHEDDVRQRIGLGWFVECVEMQLGSINSNIHLSNITTEDKTLSVKPKTPVESELSDNITRH